MNNTVSPPPSEISQFERIINKFDSQIKILDDYSTQIETKVAVMIDFEKNVSAKEHPDEKSGALVGEFDIRMEKLENINYRLEGILHNLIRLVG